MLTPIPEAAAGGEEDAFTKEGEEEEEEPAIASVGGEGAALPSEEEEAWLAPNSEDWESAGSGGEGEEEEAGGCGSPLDLLSIHLPKSASVGLSPPPPLLAPKKERAPWVGPSTPPLPPPTPSPEAGVGEGAANRAKAAASFTSSSSKLEVARLRWDGGLENPRTSLLSSPEPPPSTPPPLCHHSELASMGPRAPVGTTPSWERRNWDMREAWGKSLHPTCRGRP